MPIYEVGRAAPANSLAYKVKDGDSWVSLAAEWGLDVWSLIYFNFKTYDPTEVNYYLQEYVGCVLPTADRKNWCFSSAADPGVIYRPLEKAGPVKGEPVKYPPMPTPVPGDDPMKSPGSGNWIGIGVKGSGHVIAAGADTATIFAISMDDYRDWMMLQITTTRVGPGLGLSGGLVVCGIGNCYDPRNMRGWPVGGWDFQVAVGTKWNSMIKIAGKAAPLLEALKQGSDATNLINKTVFTPQVCDRIVNEAKNGFAALGLFPREGQYDLSVTVVDVPVLSAGTELSVYYNSGSVQLLNYNLTD